MKTKTHTPEKIIFNETQMYALAVWIVDDLKPRNEDDGGALFDQICKRIRTWPLGEVRP